MSPCQSVCQFYRMRLFFEKTDISNIVKALQKTLVVLKSKYEPTNQETANCSTGIGKMKKHTKLKKFTSLKFFLSSSVVNIVGIYEVTTRQTSC